MREKIKTLPYSWQGLKTKPRKFRQGDTPASPTHVATTPFDGGGGDGGPFRPLNLLKT